MGIVYKAKDTRLAGTFAEFLPDESPDAQAIDIRRKRVLQSLSSSKSADSRH